MACVLYLWSAEGRVFKCLHQHTANETKTYIYNVYCAVLHVHVAKIMPTSKPTNSIYRLSHTDYQNMRVEGCIAFTLTLSRHQRAHVSVKDIDTNILLPVQPCTLYKYGHNLLANGNGMESKCNGHRIAGNFRGVQNSFNSNTMILVSKNFVGLHCLRSGKPHLRFRGV